MVVAVINLCFISAEAHLEPGLTHLLLGDKQAALAEYNILSGLDQARAAGLLESINKK